MKSNVRMDDTSHWRIFSPSITQCVKQLVQRAVRRRVLAEKILNLFWSDSCLVRAFPAWHRDDTISLSFVFPVCVRYVLSGARAASVAFRTSLKSLRWDCIKIVKKSQACSHNNYYAKSGGGGEKKSVRFLWKAARYRYRHKRCLKWEHTLISLKELLIQQLPLFRRLLSTFILWHLFTLLNYFPIFFLTLAPKSLLWVHTVFHYFQKIFVQLSSSL